MKEQENILQFDKRVMHRFVAEGKMKQEELEQHLEQLPDLTESCSDIADTIYPASRTVKTTIDT